MKKKYIQIISALLLAVSIVSCDKTDGELYSGEANKISFAFSNLDLIMKGDGVLQVPIARTSTEGELSVPLVLEATVPGYTDVFKLDANSVKFENGEAKSYVKIKYDNVASVNPGYSVSRSGLDVIASLSYAMTLKFGAESKTYGGFNSTAISALDIVEFGDDKTVKLNSENGWAEEVLDVKIQQAKNGNDIYKVVSPFGFTSFSFMIQADGKTVVCPDQIIDNHPDYGEVKMGSVKGSVQDGKVILNVGNYSVEAGSFGSGIEIIDLP